MYKCLCNQFPAELCCDEIIAWRVLCNISLYSRRTSLSFYVIPPFYPPIDSSFGHPGGIRADQSDRQKFRRHRAIILFIRSLPQKVEVVSSIQHLSISPSNPDPSHHGQHQVSSAGYIVGYSLAHPQASILFPTHKIPSNDARFREKFGVTSQESARHFRHSHQDGDNT